MNPICEVRIDEIIDIWSTHRGVAIRVLVYHKGSLYSYNMYVKESPAGFLPNLLMNKEISAIKNYDRHNRKKSVRFNAIP